MEKIAKSSAINFGLYLGVVLALTTIIAYAVNLDLLVNTIYGILILLIIIAFGTISAIKAKSLSGGFLSFKHSFTSYFLTVLIGLVISSLVTYVLFNFVDQEAAKTLQEKALELQAQSMQRLGVDEAAISEMMNNAENRNQYSIGNVLLGTGGYLVLFSIIGLIVAAIVKKNPETDY